MLPPLSVSLLVSFHTRYRKHHGNSVFLWLQASIHHVHHSMQLPFPWGKKGFFLSFFFPLFSIKLLINILLQPSAWLFALYLAIIIVEALLKGMYNRTGWIVFIEWHLTFISYDTDRMNTTSASVFARARRNMELFAEKVDFLIPKEH